MTKVEIKKLDNSEVEITGEILAEEFDAYWASAVKELGEGVEVAGFRPGKAPEKVIIEKLGDDKILYRMAEKAISKAYPEIIDENKLDVIGRPEISITKIAKGNPLAFVIKTAIVPEIKLGDYKKVAKKVNAEKEESIVVEDKEVDDVIEQLRNARKPKEEGAELPEVNDDFAKSLGQFTSVEDLKTKLKENLAQDKKARAKDKKRATLLDAVAKEATIALPAILIEGEQDKMAHEMRHQIEQMGLNFDDYLKHIKKTVEELRAGWKGEAEMRVKIGLVLEEVAKVEKLEADKEKVEKEVAHLLEHHKDLDPERVKNYVESMMLNEAVINFLEGIK